MDEQLSLADQLSPEETAYFGKETIEKHIADLAADPDGGEMVEPGAAVEDKPADKPAEGQDKPADKPVEAQDKPIDQRMVPQEALHVAREEAREAKARLAQLEGRFNEVLTKLVPPQQQQEPPKSVDDDPVAAVRQHDEVLRGLAAQQAQREQFAQFKAVVDDHEARFRAEQSHYDAAVEYLAASRAKEYRALGLPEPEVMKTLHQEAISIAAFALRNGQNPAEKIYAMAQARGFVPAAQQQETPKAAAAVPDDKKMAMLEAGVKASRSLEGGANSGIGELSLSSLTEMSSKEIGELSDAQWRRLMLGS